MNKIVITGASRGVGYAVAHKMAQPGRQLVLIARRQASLADIAEACTKRGAIVTTYGCDVQDRDRLTQILLHEDGLAPIDCVIANAGLSGGNQGAVRSESRETIEAIADVNFTGAILTAACLIDRMKHRRQGHIVFIGSVMGLVGFPHSPTYSATKAGLRIYADALRTWLKPHGVTVSIAHLGYVDTDMSRGLDTPKPFMLSAPAAAARIVRGIDSKKSNIYVPGLYYWATRLLTWVPAWILTPILLRTLIDVPPPIGISGDAAK